MSVFRICCVSTSGSSQRAGRMAPNFDLYIDNGIDRRSYTGHYGNRTSLRDVNENVDFDFEDAPAPKRVLVPLPAANMYGNYIGDNYCTEPDDIYDENGLIKYVENSHFLTHQEFFLVETESEYITAIGMPLGTVDAFRFGLHVGEQSFSSIENGYYHFHKEGTVKSMWLSPTVTTSVVRPTLVRNVTITNVIMVLSGRTAWHSMTNDLLSIQHLKASELCQEFFDRAYKVERQLKKWVSMSKDRTYTLILKKTLDLSPDADPIAVWDTFGSYWNMIPMNDMICGYNAQSSSGGGWWEVAGYRCGSSKEVPLSKVSWATPYGENHRKVLFEITLPGASLDLNGRYEFAKNFRKNKVDEVSHVWHSNYNSTPYHKYVKSRPRLNVTYRLVPQV